MSQLFTLGLNNLLIISIIAVNAPYIASLIPGKPIPETVFLVAAGCILGPHGIGLINNDLASTQLMSQVGCAFLFLMAGFEIDPKDITGATGRHALITWFISAVIAFVVAVFMPILHTDNHLARIAVALAMVTTAYGTLAPIMRDRGLVGTLPGKIITAHGAIGELAPVLAMGLLLSTSGFKNSLLSLAIFALVCLVLYLWMRLAPTLNKRLIRFLRDNATTGSQATVRITVLMLILLVFVAHTMKLDIVLGAFVAGFLLRRFLPENDHVLEPKLDALAFGFFVPLFFIMSGTSIDLAAVAEDPKLFVVFIGLLLLVRALPIFILSHVWPESRALTHHQRLSVAFYCSMALPLIVAITESAVSAGAMSEATASVLVTAGATTVLAIPILTALIRAIEAAHPLAAVQELSHDPKAMREIMHEHNVRRHEELQAFRSAVVAARKEGHALNSQDFFAQHTHEDTETENDLIDRH